MKLFALFFILTLSSSISFAVENESSINLNPKAVKNLVLSLISDEVQMKTLDNLNIHGPLRDKILHQDLDEGAKQGNYSGSCQSTEASQKQYSCNVSFGNVSLENIPVVLNLNLNPDQLSAENSILIKRP